ncbi:hypothetical protein V6Z11_A08G135800 [Gossypium hirsutum]
MQGHWFCGRTCLGLRKMKWVFLVFEEKGNFFG